MQWNIWKIPCRNKKHSHSHLYMKSRKKQKAKILLWKHIGIYVLQQLITAYQAGRKVDFHAILENESLGKPDGVSNFCELSDTFVTLVLHIGHRFDRIDVNFDWYRDVSIKAGTRQRHSKHSCLIWRVVKNYSIPLPSNWTDFLAMPENKTYLACFLSKHLIANAPTDKLLVASGSL